MTFRNKIYVTIFAILEFIAVLFFLGFERSAVDRGILEEKDRLEGVLVVVLTGDSI